MADRERYLRKLAIGVKWEIAESPIRELNRAVDEAKKRLLGGSDAARKMEEATRKTGDAARRMGSSTAAAGQQAAKAAGEMNKLSTAVSKAGTVMDVFKKKATSALESTANGMNRAVSSAGKFGLLTGAGVVAGGTALAGSSLKKAMGFESQLSSINAIAPEADMTAVRNEALRAGAATKYNALQTAQGIEELMKSSMKLDEVIKGGLQAGLDLATAGGVEVDESSKMLGVALNMFKKDNLSPSQMADMIAGAANASATDVRSIGYGLASGGGVQNLSGGSAKDFLTSIGLMANDGTVGGSDAGTSIKSLLFNLQEQGDKEAELFKELGIGIGKNNIFFENGKIKDLAGIADAMQKVFSRFNEQERLKKMEEVFGTDAVRAAAMAYKQGAKGVKEFQDQMMNVTAYDVAKKKLDNAQGALEMLQGQFETIQIQALSPFLPHVRRVFEGVSGILARNEGNIVRTADRVAKAIDEKFINNQAFRDMTLKQKVTYVFDSFKKTFDEWYTSGGNEEIQQATSSLIGFISDALSGSDQQLRDIGIKLGRSVGSGMLVGLQSFMKENPMLSGMLTTVVTPGGMPVKAIAGASVTAQGYTNKLMGTPLTDAEREKRGITNPMYREGGIINGSKVFDTMNNLFEKTGANRLLGIDGSNEDGHPYIPFDGYISELHEGERVLTKEENRAYNAGQTPGGGMQLPPIVQNFYGNTSREDVYSGTMAALNEFARSYMRRNPQREVR